MASSYLSTLLGRLASPPVVITNPDLIKYLIFQLLAEATLVLTFVALASMALREEVIQATRRWKRSRGWHLGGGGGRGGSTSRRKAGG
ncbi:hypothetical protein ACHAW5_000737 [Stephanodiscus triporus]|uniref:Uncharacterized protein n=1 Tax=Stephanodiscus triporus TaxID=2934178 RepID=A0ABD3NN10_9STRA